MKTREDDQRFEIESLRILSSSRDVVEKFSWSVSEETQFLTLTIPKSDPESPFVVLKMQPVPKKELSTVSVSQL